jgi:hypothetical protein
LVIKVIKDLKGLKVIHLKVQKDHKVHHRKEIKDHKVIHRLGQQGLKVFRVLEGLWVVVEIQYKDLQDQQVTQYKDL